MHLPTNACSITIFLIHSSDSSQAYTSTSIFELLIPNYRSELIWLLGIWLFDGYVLLWKIVQPLLDFLFDRFFFVRRPEWYAVSRLAYHQRQWWLPVRLSSRGIEVRTGSTYPGGLSMPAKSGLCVGGLPWIGVPDASVWLIETNYWIEKLRGCPIPPR